MNRKEEIEMLYLGIGNKECVQQLHPVIAKIKDTISRKKYQILDDLRASSTSMSDESKSESNKEISEDNSISESNESSDIDDGSDGLESHSDESFSSFDSFCQVPSKRKELKRAKKRERSSKKINKSLKVKEAQSKGEKKETIINHIKIVNSQAVVQIRKEFFNK